MTGGGRRHIALIAGAVGCATLGAEIAAARLMAPWFGASTIVWANTIATVLVALSLGYAIGGRIADRDPTVAGLCRLVLFAAVLLAAVPFVADPFLEISVDALDSVEAGAFAGSLIGVLVLLAAPVFLLGCVAPYAIRLSVEDVTEAGRVSGRLYAISTLGSLVGVFSSALVLIPFAGTRRTFLAYALLCVAVALPGVRRRAALAPAALLVLVGLMALPIGIVKAQAGAGEVIWERDTEYQYARVIEDPDGTRDLELNEGQAVHSRLPGDRSHLTGNYWDEPLVLPFLGRTAPPGSVAMLGTAAGTIPRAYGRFFPRTRVDAVELDPDLLDVGRELFDLRGDRLVLHEGDARPWLRRTERRFDVIYVDAYRQPYIPFYLTTREFFALCRDRLNRGGMVVINVGHPEGSDALEKVLAATLRTAFAHVVRDPSEDTNTQLIASAAPLRPERLASARVPTPLRPLAVAAAARIGDAPRGGRVYTDDVAPVEWLVDTSILEVASDGG